MRADSSLQDHCRPDQTVCAPRWCRRAASAGAAVAQGREGSGSKPKLSSHRSVQSRCQQHGVCPAGTLPRALSAHSPLRWLREPPRLSQCRSRPPASASRPCSSPAQGAWSLRPPPSPAPARLHKLLAAPTFAPMLRPSAGRGLHHGSRAGGPHLGVGGATLRRRQAGRRCRRMAAVPKRSPRARPGKGISPPCISRSPPAAAGWVLSHDALRLDLQDLARLLDALAV